MIYKIPFKFGLSKAYQCGSYIRQDILQSNDSIGHISYKIDDKTLIIDMIRIDVVSLRNKGFAGKALADVINKNKVIKITSSEDGFSSLGREFIKNFTNANGGYWDKNIGMLRA